MRVRIRRFRDLIPRGRGFVRLSPIEASPLPRFLSGFTLSDPWQAPPKRVGWRMAIHESRVLLFTITARAFVRWRTITSSADFCCEIKAPCNAFTHDSATHSRSPEVSSTAFGTQPPNLQPVPLMDMDFAIIGPLVRRRMPQIRLLYIGSYVCSTLLSDPTSR
jgi:hypothetical protein